jgi:hypothetical protein
LPDPATATSTVNDQDRDEAKETCCPSSDELQGTQPVGKSGGACW